MKKKSILFVAFGLGIGGIEKCLVNLVNALPEEKYDIDVLLMNAQYDLKPQIKESVHFLDEFTYIVLDIRTILNEMRCRGEYIKHLGKLFRYAVYRIADKLGFTPWRIHGRLPKHYDIAVAYSQNGEAPYYVMDRVQADRKVLWYHNGAYEKIGKAYALDQKYYTQYDYVVGVSDFCKQLLCEKFSFRDGQLVVLQNICDVPGILRSSMEFKPQSFSGDSFHIVTVGRMAMEKGVDLALEACRILCDEGKNICWHWIGNGDLLHAIQSQIAELGLEGRFVPEGNQTNPYPYIANCDLYVQTSRYESYSMTTMEAKILHKPIVITGVGGMKKLIRSGENGLITEPDARAIADAVGTLIENNVLRMSFTDNLKQEDYSADAFLEEYGKQVFA